MYFFTSLPPPIPLDPLSLPLSFSTSVIILSKLSVLLRSSASAFAPDILGLRCTTESANRNIDFDLIISFILGCLCTTWWQWQGRHGQVGSSTHPLQTGSGPARSTIWGDCHDEAEAEALNINQTRSTRFVGETRRMWSWGCSSACLRGGSDKHELEQKVIYRSLEHKQELKQEFKHVSECDMWL